MVSNMTPQDAARSLFALLRDRPWLTTVGVGQQDGATVLFVYAKTTRGIRLPLDAGTWEGFPVRVKKMGTPRPAGK